MKRSVFFFAAMIIAGGMASATSLGFFAVSPQGNFLEQAPIDVCSEYNIAGCNMTPTFINLTALGVTAGESLTITDVGGLCVYDAQGCTVYPASAFNMGAVFSSTDTLLPVNVENRVPDQIAPGAGALLVGTNPNIFAIAGNIDTAIPDDFYISATVIVPQGANYLIVGVLDSAYADNSSTLLGVNLSVPDSPESVTPEPTSYAMMLGGLGALWMLRRKSGLAVIK
jgi:hypothetical protein